MPDELLSMDEINALMSGGGEGLGDVEDVPEADAEQLAKVADTFANSENSVINILAGKNVTTNVSAPEVMTQTEFTAKFSELPFIFSSTFGGFDDRPLSLVVEQKGALTLASLMMGGGGEDITDPSDLYWNAAQEGLSQVVGSAFTSLSGLLGGRRLMPENSVSSVAEDDWIAIAVEPAETKLWISQVNVVIDGLKPFNIWTCLALDDALEISNVMRGGGRPEPQPQASAPTGGGGIMGGRQNPGPAVNVNRAEFQPLGGGNAGGAPSPIDLIADIPVRVTVELGKARKSVSEILALTTGAVVELDKMAGEPVDILVNGKLIAHGEVVVIDENFGVRITDIIPGGAARAAS